MIAGCKLNHKSHPWWWRFSRRAKSNLVLEMYEWRCTKKNNSSLMISFSFSFFWWWRKFRLWNWNFFEGSISRLDTNTRSAYSLINSVKHKDQLMARECSLFLKLFFLLLLVELLSNVCFGFKGIWKKKYIFAWTLSQMSLISIYFLFNFCYFPELISTLASSFFSLNYMQIFFVLFHFYIFNNFLILIKF